MNEQKHKDKKANDSKQKRPSSFSRYRAYNAEYKKHSRQYRMALLTIDFVMAQLFFQTCSWLASLVMRRAGIPYLAHSTMSILVRHPLALILLLLDLLLFALSIYFQFILTLTCVKKIREGDFHLLEIFREAFLCLRRTGLQTIPFVLIYMIIVMPFGSLVFKSEAFEKIVIPHFISDYIFSKWYLALPFALIYLGVLYFAVRWIYALPLLVMRENMTLHQAFRESAQLTRGRKLGILWRIGLIAFLAGVLVELFMLILCGVQLVVDLAAPRIAQAASGVLLGSIMDLLQIYYSIRMSVILLQAVIPDEMDEPGSTRNVQDPRKKHKTWQHPHGMICKDRHLRLPVKIRTTRTLHPWGVISGVWNGFSPGAFACSFSSMLF